MICLYLPNWVFNNCLPFKLVELWEQMLRIEFFFFQNLKKKENMIKIQRHKIKNKGKKNVQITVVVGLKLKF